MMNSLFDHTYTQVRADLLMRLEEPAPGRVQILTGPRQVGKTTLLGEIESAFGPKAIYLAADAPEASLPGWWETQWQRARRTAEEKGASVLLLDEIQAVPEWSRRLKAEADRLRRERIGVHVVATGSSALQVGAGARETMAGRFERLRLLHWPALELVRRLGVPQSEAAHLVVTHGGYPGSLAFRSNERRFRRYLLDSIIEPALGRDIARTESVRKPALLRQVYAVATGHPSEILSLQKIQGSLAESGALATVAHYLHVLEEACLVAAVPKFSRRMVRQRASPPKLVALNNALLRSAVQPPPTPARDPRRWGRWVENACLALAWNTGQSVHYWREEPHEVDLVCEGAWGSWVVEIKTGPYAARDLAGLLEFHRRHQDVRPLVLCDPGREDPARRLGVDAMAWDAFLLGGPGSHTG